MIWQTLTHFWKNHDLLFTEFGSFRHWVHWNMVHFSCLPGIQDWEKWHALWAWVNIHG